MKLSEIIYRIFFGDLLKYCAIPPMDKKVSNLPPLKELAAGAEGTFAEWLDFCEEVGEIRRAEKLKAFKEEFKRAWKMFAGKTLPLPPNSRIEQHFASRQEWQAFEAIRSVNK